MAKGDINKEKCERGQKEKGTDFKGCIAKRHLFGTLQVKRHIGRVDVVNAVLLARTVA